jgi:HD-GYP domain-containing protein (c-di-GMP phosphodiesterase class II)
MACSRARLHSMRLVATRRIRAGFCLARDIPAPGGGRVPLLRAGIRMTDRHRDALLGAGINAIYVDDELGEGIDVPRALSEETRREARDALSRALAAAPSAIAGGGALPREAIREMEAVVSAIAAEVAACGESAVALADLAGADSYTLEHSIDVTVVGLLVGRRLFSERGRVDFRGQRSFDRIERHLTQLGIGLMLHDVGKLAVPTAVLHKPGALDGVEWDLIRRHPLDGLAMLETDLIGARAKSVVRSHHERWDGSGYPDGLAGDAIFQFARIASVADVFDAITSERPYAVAAPQHVGVAAIRGGSGTAFEPEVVDVFCEVVPPYPPGSEIVLADGRTGVVVTVPRGAPACPRVRVFQEPDGESVAAYEIDLLDAPELVPADPEVPRRPRPVEAVAEPAPTA